MKNQKNNPGKQKSNTAAPDQQRAGSAETSGNNPQNKSERTQDLDQPTEEVSAEGKTDVRKTEKGRMPGDTGKVAEDLNDMEMDDLEDGDDVRKR